MVENEKTHKVILTNEIEPLDLLLISCSVFYDSDKKSVNVPITNYALFCIFSGSGIYRLNGKNFRISRGDVCFIPMGVEYTTIPDPGSVIQHYHLGFNGSNVPYFLKKTEFSLDNPVVHTNSDEIIKKFKSTLDTVSQNTFCANVKANLIFFDILYYFFQRMQNNNNSKKTLHKNEFVERVINYIKSNYMFDIKVSDIASNMHINRSYLSNLFSATLGISIKQYLTNYRMSVALKLLHDTNKPISEVSTLSGFPDTISFYKQFKKATSYSPQQYKTKLKIDPRYNTITKV